MKGTKVADAVLSVVVEALEAGVAHKRRRHRHAVTLRHHITETYEKQIISTKCRRLEFPKMVNALKKMEVLEKPRKIRKAFLINPSWDKHTVYFSAVQKHFVKVAHGAYLIQKFVSRTSISSLQFKQALL